MAARNDVTGDEIKSKTGNKQYAENWQRIFGNKKETEKTDKKEAK